MGKAYWLLLVFLLVAFMAVSAAAPEGWDEPLPTPPDVWWWDDTPRPAFWQKGEK